MSEVLAFRLPRPRPAREPQEVPGEISFLPLAARAWLSEEAIAAAVDALVPFLIEKNEKVATAWWAAHASRIDRALTRRGISPKVRVAVIAEHTSLVRVALRIAAARKRQQIGQPDVA